MSGNYGSRTHCANGHPFSGSNLRIRPVDGARVCRICEAECGKRKRAAKQGPRRAPLKKEYLRLSPDVGSCKKCSGCQEIKPLSEFWSDKCAAGGKCAYCKLCSKEQWKRSQARYPLRYKARNKAKHAIREKRLIKEPCEICQSPDTEAHHDDYSKPLDVRWLCKTHHTEWHRYNKPIDGGNYEPKH